MEDYDNNSLRRCYNILIGCTNIEELLERIEESINDSYSREQCYKDILENANLNRYVVEEFINHIILSNNKEDKDILVRNFGSIAPEVFSDLITYLKVNKKSNSFLKNEIKKGLISNKDLGKVISLYKFLKSEEDGKQIIEERFEDFLSAGCDFRLINEILEEIEIPEERVIENKAKILENAKEESLISFIKWFNERGVLSDTDIELEDFVKSLHSNAEDKTILKMLEIIYKRLMEKQQLNIKDIEILGKGAFSSSYKIGQYVLKFGEPRKTEKIPYHRRILQPVIRQDISPNDEKNLYIEIQNEVDNKWYNGMTEQQIQEELYKIYKEMRESGIIWTDVKKENVGRLIRPNKTNYYSETLEGNIEDEETLKTTERELEVSDDSVGIFGRKKEDCLQSGEFVILDTDYIFKEEEINFREDERRNGPLKYIIFEKRYIKEKEEEQR